MKKLLTIAIMTAAVSALAVESSNTFGILRVDSSAEQTIVSVPWEAAGATGDDAGKIMVKDIVKTANLTKETVAERADGDMLYLYTGSQYYAWYLSIDGVWKGIQVAASDGLPAAANDDTKKISRGDAIILVRKNTTQPFYLYGQYTNAGASVSATRNASASVYMLIAPPQTSDVSVSSITSTNLIEGDALVFGNTSLVWNATENKWGVYGFELVNYVPTKKFTESNASIPVGTGAWLRLKAANSSQTVTISL